MFCSTSTIDSPLFLELADGGHHLGDDLRREAFRRLVHQQHARIGHQRAADREHLLLAAGKIGRHLRAPLGEPREHGEHRLGGPRRVRLPGSGLRAATIRFSRTVRLLKMRRPCGTSATPRAAICSGASRVTARAEHLDRAARAAAAGRR